MSNPCVSPEISSCTPNWLNCSLAVCAVVLVLGLFHAAHRVCADISAPPKVYTDGKTGCQYIRAGLGITPRLDGATRQLGCRWVDPDSGYRVDALALQTQSISSLTSAYGEAGKKLVPDGTTLSHD